MIIPSKFIESLQDPLDYISGRSIYHIGIVNSIDMGIKRFFNHLNNRGHILIEEPEIIDYIDYLYNDDIIYLIIYKSLPKLEYLEYMWEKKVDNNNGKKTL